jgi:hypothetical protein
MPSRKDSYSTVQISEGAWHRVGNFDHHECCDCGLVHKEEFKLVKGVLYWRTYRDDKKTSDSRKKHGITLTRITRKKP